MNKPILLLDFFNTALNLKNIARQGWIDKLSITKPESVADHTFSLAIMGMVLADSRNLNTEKILKMILLHDLAESITGDITPEQKPKNEKKDLENKTMKKILLNLPKNLQIQYLKLWDEYNDNKTDESVFVHNIDKLEMALQAKSYEKQTNEEKILPFLDSARNGINDPNLLKLLKRIVEK